jgi:V8-like Glu-specific endopeptidase
MIVYDSGKWPYSPHGHLAMLVGGNLVSGSGVLIGRRHVLTAAHNVEPITGPAPAKLFFNAGQAGINTPHLPSRVLDWFVHARWRKERDPGWDIAVLRLDRHVGEEARTHSISILPDAALQNLLVEVTGYPGSGDAVMWTLRGTLNTPQKDLLTYGMPTLKGQSGGAIWCWFAGSNPQVIGVHTFAHENGTRSGVRLTKEKLAALKHWVSS